MFTGFLAGSSASGPNPLILLQVCAAPDSHCGDWLRASILATWPSPIAEELASFIWPITDEEELTRLLFAEHAAPQDVVGGEFTASIRQENERIYQVVTLSVDYRHSLVPGVHACLDMRLVLHRKQWVRAYIFPHCTHVVLSDKGGRKN